MKRRLFPVLTLILALLLPQSALAWNGPGHQLVARIAWENMTPTARRNAIALLQAAPQDACLLDLFPNSGDPDIRQREFFMRVSTWPDIVRPRRGGEDTRACTRFHRANWHFINFFWEGTSGATGSNAPRDRQDIAIPEVNAVERLKFFRPFVCCSMPPCGTPQEERATTLAWILHLVGDIHQPLHTSARVTLRPDEGAGDRGGNLFLLNSSGDTLHGFWDNIVNNSIPQQPGESDMAYLERVALQIMQDHPRSGMLSRLRPGDFEAWAREGFETSKREAYPSSLRRGRRPSASYQANTLRIAREAIALGGYRLADLLNQMFGS